MVLKKLRAAIVGAGLMGRWHACYATRVGADVVAIVDRSLSNASRLQNRYPNARMFEDLSHCLESCELDVVHICTGLDSHVSLVDAALRAGKHVLVEKPMARSAEEVKYLLNQAQDRALQLSVVHQFPWQRGFRQIQRVRNRLGDITHITYCACSATGADCSDFQRRELLLEILPHSLSLAYGLLEERGTPELKLLTSSSDELTIGGDIAGVPVTIFLSLRGRPTRNELTIFGTRATAHLDLFHGYRVLESGHASRSNKILRPFRHGVGILVAASWNMITRITHRHPAYPGLPELIAQFYRSIQDPNFVPIPPNEMLWIASCMDQVRSQASRAR